MLVDAVQALGARTVEVKWNSGYNAMMGWMTLQSRDSDWQALSLRSAAVVEWVHDNLSAKKIATVSCSGGSIALFSARYWHDADRMLAYQLLVGGPFHYDINAGCGVGQTSFKWKPINGVDLAGLVTDYIHQTGTTCQDKQGHARYPASGLSTTQGDWNNEHSIDILLNLGVNGDDDSGLDGQAKAIAAQLTGAVTVTELSGGAHCAAFNGGEGSSRALALLRNGFNL